MKKCTYCGKENADDASYCSGCFQDEYFKSDSPDENEKSDAQEELLTLMSCNKLTDADLVLSRLESAGIEAFIPDQHLMQTIGFNLNTYGYVRVQVRRKDYDNAKELLSQPATPPAETQVSTSGGLRTIASLEVGQTGEIMERLKREAIPAELRTVTQESGLEMCEVMVEDSFYDRGCDVVEAWDAEKVAAQKKRSGIRCRKCGSQNYSSTWVEKIGNIYNCKDCGNDFVW